MRAIFLVKSLVKTTLPAIAAEVEERKMLATLVREFLLNEVLSLEKIALLAASLDRIKVKNGVNLSMKIERCVLTFTQLLCRQLPRAGSLSVGS